MIQKLEKEATNYALVYGTTGGGDNIPSKSRNQSLVGKWDHSRVESGATREGARDTRKEARVSRKEYSGFFPSKDPRVPLIGSLTQRLQHKGSWEM